MSDDQMDRFEEDFDSEYNPREKKDFTPNPEGDYKLVINSVGWKEAKDGSHKYIKIEIGMLDAPHKSTIFHQLCVRHPNAKPKDIAKKQFQALCTALGFDNFPPFPELVGKMFRGHVKIEENPADGKLSNVLHYVIFDDGEPVGSSPEKESNSESGSKWA